MRACLFFLVAVWLAVPGAFAASAADGDGFAHGNQLYASGKYVEAVAAYESQVRRGADSANLFYNLGDAYQRLGNRGRAILNFQRALLLEPSHAEAAANLAFIGGNRPPELTTGSPLDANALSWLTAAACWLALAGVMAFALRRRLRNPGLILATVGLLGGLAGAWALWWIEGKTHTASRALTVAERVPVFYSPADNSKIITTLPAGAEVRVLSSQGPWSYALLGDGTRAWVSSGKIERLVPPH